jgi:hypothetical protein
MATTRLLSQVYDPGMQAESCTWGNDEAFRVLLGQLRLDTILYEQIVIVDADVFDGRFFLDASNRGLLSELPWPRIELRMRSTSLEESFIRQLAPKDEPYLARYFFESIPLEAARASAIAKELGKTPSSAITKFSDVLPILIACGVDEQDAMRCERSWKNLLDSMGGNGCRIVKWKSPTEFSFKENFARQVGTVPYNLVWRLTEDGKRVYNDVIRVRNSRSEVLAILNPLIDSGSEEFNRDVATMRTWYQSCYKGTQALQHECDNWEYFLYPGCRPLDQSVAAMEEKGEESIGEFAHTIAGNFLLQLGSLPVTQFEECHRHVAAGIREWDALCGSDREAARQKLKDTMKRLVEKVDSKSSIKATIEPADGSSMQNLVEQAAATSAIAVTTAYLSKRTFLKAAAIGGGAAVVGVFIPEGIKYMNPQPSRSTKVAESIVRMEEHRRTR